MPEVNDTLCAHDDGEPPSFEVNITLHDKRWRAEFVHAEQFIEQHVKNILISEQCSENSTLAIVLSNDAEIHTMNRDFRHKDKPTNVLSFPDEEEGVLGDIVLSFDTLKREAKEQNKTLEHHVIHMLTHGVLHLLGHDHQEEEEAGIMEAREIAFLASLNISNPYSEV